MEGKELALYVTLAAVARSPAEHESVVKWLFSGSGNNTLWAFKKRRNLLRLDLRGMLFICTPSVLKLSRNRNLVHNNIVLLAGQSTRKQWSVLQYRKKRMDLFVYFYWGGTLMLKAVNHILSVLQHPRAKHFRSYCYPFLMVLCLLFLALSTSHVSYLSGSFSRVM